jgi:hypothetical protein
VNHVDAAHGVREAATWPQEAAGYARIIAELVQAGVITDEVLAGLGGDTNRLLGLRTRAVSLWDEATAHANPGRWLEEIGEQTPGEVVGELMLRSGLRTALASAPADEDVVHALARLYRADVVDAAHAEWAADSEAVRRLVDLAALADEDLLPEDRVGDEESVVRWVAGRFGHSW